MQALGIARLDIILISGDAYIDHPSFGVAIIARFLEAHGFSVGVLAQPDISEESDFQVLGQPKLFFGITSGNMDSMVNKYTSQKKIRSEDAYSPNGDMSKRPDRALLPYTQIIKKLFKGTPVVLGGVEASLRRIPHYDYWSDKIKNSLLLDTKADILVYGNGEKQILEIANNLKKGNPLHNIAGTVSRISKTDLPTDAFIGTGVDLVTNPETYFEFCKQFEDNFRTKTIYYPFAGSYLQHNPPAQPMTTEELDFVYNLPFSREPHPIYKNKTFKAFEQIKLSITSHRGCFGGCNFCAIGKHQGKTIQSRSQESIQAELKAICQKKYFKGTITDIGGPSANLYGMSCKRDISEICSRKSCLQPTICPNLNTDHAALLRLLKTFLKDPQIKHLFTSSGVRFDLSLDNEEYIKLLADSLTSGKLKLAPEHIASKTLKFMNKPEFTLYEQFVKKFEIQSQKVKKNQMVVPYIIVGHPGSTLEEALELAVYLRKRNIRLEQIQEFLPTPMTISTVMYYTGKNWETGKPIHVPKGREIRLQKALVQWFDPENKNLVKEALKLCKRTDLINFFLN